MKLPRHHYIPEFYLKQWAAPEDGRLFEFARRYHKNVPKVVARPTHPGGTGYVRGLNLMEAATPELREQFETVIMGTVDNRAQEALLKLKSDDNSPWLPKPRSSWTRFIISLMFRNPEALEKIRSQIAKLPLLNSAEARAAYEQMAQPGAPDFDAYMREDVGAARFQFILSMMNQKSLGNRINNMIWQRCTFANSPYSVLTSDRPVIFWQVNGRQVIVVPTGPNTLFVAFHDYADFERLRSTPLKELIVKVNRHVVERAVRFVWGADTHNQRFIENRLGADNKNDLFYLDLERAARGLEAA